MSLTPAGVGLFVCDLLASPLALFPRSCKPFPIMAEKLDPKEIATLEELATFNT